MPTLLKTIVIGSLVSIVMACSAEAVNNEAAAAIGLPKLQQPEPNTLTSGQPSKAHFAALAEQGIQHIVNLRPRSEQNWDEKQYVESLGMRYHHIPVVGAAGVTPENAVALNDVLKSIGNEPTLVHCASGNRVGGLVALHEGLSNNTNADQAIAKGKRWGLTRLEPLVRQQLSTAQAQ